MTHLERVEAWHHNRPTWAMGFSAQDWGTAEEIARRFDMIADGIPMNCPIEPPAAPGAEQHGYCRLPAGHDGPCDVMID